MQTAKCSDQVLGLKIYIKIKNQKITLNKDFEVDLIFKNISKQPIRIYFINEEFFRSFQSRFYLLADGKCHFLTDISPAHGYVVTENDFHLIDPNKEIVFKQTLSIDSTIIKSKSSKTYLEWIYENQISRWEGNIQTLDGPTKKLFDGERIPFIWIGKINSLMEIEIIK